MKYKLGIALGGGGARGFAHLGILEALNEKGIKPDIISGVSAGAIAGAFIASGHTPREAFEIIKKYKFTGISEFNIPKTGLLSSDKMKSGLLKKIPTEKLEDLDIPLIICVSNMLDGKPEYMSEGPIADIVQASASIPVLFSPVKLNGKLYSDGGIFDNVPIKVLKDKCEKVIGVSISPIQEIEELTSLIQVSSRMFQLAVNRSRSELQSQCDIFIEPLDLCNYDIMDTKHAQEIFDIGYSYTKELDIKL
ncbi:patatin-like phospholipase family protein [Ekhidna sp.]|uniref:patatin-like phospholipase family protein n=1 Tax=Ekhidna sp. TaxID=2608089 RepID=UPI0032989762